MASLEITDLTVEYEAQGGYTVRPLDGFTASCRDGELVILLGPSGSGKTTLLSCLAGLLTPTSGAIRVDGRELTELKGPELAAYRRHGVGVAFQAFNLVPSLNARENVAAPLRLAGVSWREAERRADELLERVGLGDRLRHKPAQLSGGQKQRVAIARALVHDPPLILADEPTSSLDYVSVEEVLLLIRRLAEPGRVVIVATHDERFNPLADRVIELQPMGGAAADAEPFEKLLAAGETLFEQGDPADFVYLVQGGEVEVFRRHPDGSEERLTVFGPGKYFGEVGPLLKLPRTASVRGLSDARLEGMGLRDFRRRTGADRRVD